MNKQIKDYLHYYIGQTATVKMKSSEKELIIEMTGWNLYANEDEIEFVKPHLRPLSSMTEEHLLELMTMCYKDVYGNEPEFIRTECLSEDQGGGFVAEEEDWRYGLTVTEKGIDFSANGSFLHHNPFEIVHKLYQWGYDLHGLIEEGLAIDKTTLKN